MSRATQPVVFFAFANDRVEHIRYLRNLPEEQRQVRDAMAAAVDADLCELVERANATVDEVLDVFQDPKYRDRVAVFHFGGHAGGAELLLESAEGKATVAHAGGLARFLGQQRGLELVFLNGCSSAGQVQGLLDAGVPAVIATSQAINDGVATELSTRFYRALASGAPIRSAFTEAQEAVQTRRGDLARGTYRSFVPEVVADDRWPWDLYVAPGAEERVARWSLPLAARDPLFGLPLPPAMDLPLSPFKHLDWFTREDAEVFFGRGQEIRDLYEAVTLPDAAPIVLLFGATGVGKSSLLAAGLAPRLEASHEVVYLRRDGALGLAGTLAQAFGGEAWREREENAGKPLVVILDQVEEAWTRPPAGRNEGEELAAALRSIFAIRETRPRGRLILGFRKEWLAEVLRLLNGAQLPRVLLEIPHLGRDGITEAVIGPARTERLRRQYNLEVEPQVADDIAGDLSEDAGAAVAPALQILLSKMWTVASQESPGAPRFTLELYQTLKRKGILLADFLEEQLAELKSWRPKLVESGLALDLLAHHTTPLGTAETRQASEVVERYGGRQEVMELLGQCKDRFLLTGTARVQGGELVGDADEGDAANPAAKGTTRLAHDTVAPLVRRRFETSDLPGQRAVRVLAQRAVDWGNSKQGAPLDEVDLTIVEQGSSGMRAWTADERRLVEASQRERDRRVARRRTFRILAGMAVIAIASSAGVAWWKQREAEMHGLRALDASRVAVASDYIDKDARVAMTLLREVQAPEEVRGWRGATTKLLKQLGTQFEVTLRSQTGQTEEVSSAKFSPDGRYIFTTSLDSTARVWSVDGTHELRAFKGHEAYLRDATFSPDGSRIVRASGDGTARVWSADGSGELMVLRHQGPVSSAAFSPDGRRIVTTSRRGTTAQVWSTDGAGEPVILIHVDLVLSAAFSPDGRRIVTASADKTARVWPADGSGQPVILRGHESLVTSAFFSPDGWRVVTASADGTARVWLADGSGEPVVLRGHKDMVLSAAFSPEGSRLVTASADYTARVWSLDGTDEPVVLKGHRGPVWSAAFSPDGQRVLTASEDGTVRLWTLDGIVDSVFAVSNSSVREASFSPDGSKLVVITGEGAAKILDILPRLDFLLTRLRDQDGDCIVPKARAWLLGQPEVEARHAYEECRQRTPAKNSFE